MHNVERKGGEVKRIKGKRETFQESEKKGNVTPAMVRDMHTTLKKKKNSIFPCLRV